MPSVSTKVQQARDEVANIKHEAVLKLIKEEMEKNLKSNVHYYKGKHWVYGNSALLASKLPGISINTVETAIAKFLKNGTLLRDQLNLYKSKRSNWYTVVDGE